MGQVPAEEYGKRTEEELEMVSAEEQRVVD